MTIYKNIINDIRIYYNNQYYSFLEENGIDIKNSLVQLPLFPLLVYQFMLKTFDKELVELFCPGENNMNMYFAIASFL
jgi:hypothetical protein